LFVSSPVFFFLLFSSLHHCIDSASSLEFGGRNIRVSLFSSRLLSFCFHLASSFARVVSFLPRVVSFLPCVISSFPRVLFLTSSLSLQISRLIAASLHRESIFFLCQAHAHRVLPCGPSTITNENSRCTHCGQSFPTTSFRYNTLPCDILRYDILSLRHSSLRHPFATTHFPATSFPMTHFLATSFPATHLPATSFPTTSYDTFPTTSLRHISYDILPYDI
jgi:hypothetical protein